MPKERLDKNTSQPSNPKVYADLQSLIKLQYEIRGFSLLPKQPVQSMLTGKHRSKLRGRGLDFNEVRAYAQGDDIRTIDWKITARTQKPHTKTYTEERERPVFIVVDQSASMFFGSENNLKSVTAAHIAALSAWKVLAVGDRVGGVVFNDSDYIEQTPKRDRKAVQRFLQHVVDKNKALSVKSFSQSNSDMLNAILQMTSQWITHDYLVMIISDFEGFNTQSMKTLISISKHNDIILGMVNDPMEKELPQTELILGNGKMQARAEAGNNKLRKNYRGLFQQHRDRIKEQTKAYGITFLEFSTINTASEQIRDMLNPMNRN